MTRLSPEASPDHGEGTRAPVLDTTELADQAFREPDPIRAAHLREQVVLSHRGLAISLASRFEGKGGEHDDLVQVAMLGLVQAARRYRPDAGHGFTAFASPTITGELKRYLRDHGWAVRPPRGLQELHHQVRETAARLQQEQQSEPSDMEVAEELGISVEQVRTARAVGGQYRARSLDVPVHEQSEQSLGDLLGDDEDPFDEVVSLLSLRAAVADLGDRDRRVLRLRFVKELTQREIGERVGVSQMQVSRILTSVYSRLRSSIEGQPGGVDEPRRSSDLVAGDRPVPVE